MNEAGLKLSLDAYKLQLQQVKDAILAKRDGPDANELLQLKEDLSQLVDLTEESLLSLQKSTLLESLCDTSQAGDSGVGSLDEVKEFDHEVNNFYSELAQTEHNGDSGIAVKEPIQTTKKYADDEMAKFYNELKENERVDDKNGYICQDARAPCCFKGQSDKTLDPGPYTLKASYNTVNFVENNEYSDASSSRDGLAQILTELSPDTDPLNDEFLDSIEDVDDISGVRCQAPHATDWMGKQYHNAMIQCPVQDRELNEDIKLKVLFLNPTLPSMLPCPYYLEGNCKFKEDQCRFSHGHIVSLYDLRPFKEPDYSLLHKGGDCLAKFMDGIWKPAVVQKIKEDHFYDIKFVHKSGVFTLELQDVIPVIDHTKQTELLTSDSDEDIVTEISPSTVGTYSSFGSPLPSNGVAVRLGLWEEHTTGMGSKLMQKMGYQLGQGLGKASQGRLEPVPIVFLPPGKSLDHCMQLKAEKGIRNMNDNTIRRINVGSTNPKKIASGSRRKRKNCVFTFLNKTLGDKFQMRKGKNGPDLQKDMFGIKEGKDKKNTKHFNKEVFKNDEEMKKLRSRADKLKDAIRRNEMTNPAVAKSMRAKLSEVKNKLDSMKDYNAKIKLHRSRMETHRKMTVF